MDASGLATCVICFAHLMLAYVQEPHNDINSFGLSREMEEQEGQGIVANYI